MHMGALATVGAVAPQNLTIILIQNGVHAASGGQPLTNKELNFSKLAQSLGVDQAQAVDTVDEFGGILRRALNRPGPEFIAASVQIDLQVVRPPEPFNPVVTKVRFSRAIDAPRYIPTTFGGGGMESGD
jgi:thiamine pyrophosphate-dependent acetolactate synthase large subunit-like protein